MASLAKVFVTIEEFEAMLDQPQNENRLIELIDGEVVEKVVSEVHGVIVMRLGHKIMLYLDTHPIARVTSEVHHRGAAGKGNVYQPDIAVTLLENALPVSDRGAVARMPDLAVEVWSPSNSLTSLRKKADYYLANGSRLVWIIYPKKRLVEVYDANQDVEILTAGDTLEGGDILPGFTLAVTDIFEAVR
jgi:Uma2 family endonuclease